MDAKSLTPKHLLQLSLRNSIRRTTLYKLLKNRSVTSTEKLVEANERGFLVIELLLALLLLAITAVGVSKLLFYRAVLAQQTEWRYQATLSANNSLASYSLSGDSASEGAAFVEWQAWLAETFPESKIVLKKTDKIAVQCLPPPGSKLTVIELEE